MTKRPFKMSDLRIFFAGEPRLMKGHLIGMDESLGPYVAGAKSANVPSAITVKRRKKRERRKNLFGRNRLKND